MAQCLTSAPSLVINLYASVCVVMRCADVCIWAYAQYNTASKGDMTMAKTFSEIAKVHEDLSRKALESVRDALKKGDLPEYGKRMAVLKKEVNDFNLALCNVAYDQFMQAQNPMIAAVQQFYIETVKIKEERDKESDVLTGVSLEKKQSRVDLEKFCKFARLDTTWAADCSKLLALLTLRETNVFAIKPSDLAKKSHYFVVAASRKMDGETPDSNTQIVRLLQQIIDEAIFVDDGKGKNKYKCNNHDIAFIQDAVTKMDTKEKCTIAMLNERQFKTVMMSVFAHCLGESYQVRASKIKAEA